MPTFPGTSFDSVSVDNETHHHHFIDRSDSSAQVMSFLFVALTGIILAFAVWGSGRE